MLVGLPVLVVAFVHPVLFVGKVFHEVFFFTEEPVHHLVCIGDVLFGDLTHVALFVILFKRVGHAGLSISTHAAKTVIELTIGNE